MNKIFVLAAGFAVVCALAGCETVKGVGKDIVNTSDSVQHAFSKGR